MKNRTLTFFALIILCALASLSVQAQTPTNGVSAASAHADSSTAEALTLARAAVKAQGGSKFLALRNLVLVGTVDLYSPNSTQPFPAKFVSVSAGDRMRLEIQSSVFNLRQVDNGQQNYSSIGSMKSPPARLGLTLLSKFEQPGYSVSLLPATKKQKAFRITDAEGNATDFYVDAVSGQIVRYVTVVGGYNFSVENKEVKQTEGVLVPFNYVQKLDSPQGSFFAEFKVKEVKLNQDLGEEVFAIPAQ
ncbi:MAG TPA: hypothetical protein VF791_13165 [Pyrinomonadaceae bacterium]